MRFYYGKGALAGFAVAIVTLLLSGVFSFIFNRDFIHASRMVTHTNEVLFHVEQVEASLATIRSNKFGYIITQRESYLTSYTADKDSLLNHMERLKKLTMDNPRQVDRVARLQKNIDKRLSLNDDLLVTRKISVDSARRAMIANTQEGPLKKERETIINAIQKEEKTLLQQRMDESEQNVQRFNYSFIFLILTTMVLLVMVFITVNANLRALIHTEAKLRKASDEVQDLYNNAPCGYHSLDGEGYFTDINTTLLGWLGYRREEVIQKFRVTDILTQKSGDDFKRNFPEFKKKGAVQNLELEFVRKNREIFPVVINSTAIYDEDGNYIKSRSSSFDITEQKLAETKLIAASQEIHDLYDNAPCGYYSADDNGNIVNINATLLKWLGYERHDVVGIMTSSDIIHRENSTDFDFAADLLAKDGYIESMELEMTRKDGRAFPVHVTASALRDTNGRHIRSRVSVFDITERKRAEAKAHELHKELEAFTYSVSHDLRAPLRSISGFMKILEEDYGHQFDAEGKRVMDTVIRNAKIMGQLIDDLLEFSRNSRKEIKRERTDMNRVVQEIVDEQNEQNPNRRIHFSLEPLAEGFADDRMIRQVWINLIQNAVKYTRPREEARISISSYIKGDITIYTVKDNGVGFDMKYSDKLFGVFQRLHRMEEFEGTGVGLALAHRIVTRHGGKIWAEAEINGGATFSFYLLNEPTSVFAI